MLFAELHARLLRRIHLIPSALCVMGALSGLRAADDGGLKMRIGYVSEQPLAWRAGSGDPLQTWVGNLSVLFAGNAPAEDAYAATNLIGEESWEALGILVGADAVDLLPMRAADFLLDGEGAGLEALLTAGHGNTPGGTRFVLITSNTRKAPIAKIMDLENQTVLVDRDGCGELVDFWLDVLIAKNSGAPRRVPVSRPGERPQKPFGARFRVVSDASEAVLPVYFNEVAACVVSESALARVVALNPGQIPLGLKEALAVSPVLATHVLAARSTLKPEEKINAAQRAARETLPLPSGDCPLTTATPASLAPLRELLAVWKTLQPADTNAAPQARRRAAEPAPRRISARAAQGDSALRDSSLHSAPQ